MTTEDGVAGRQEDFYVSQSQMKMLMQEGFQPKAIWVTGSEDFPYEYIYPPKDGELVRDSRGIKYPTLKEATQWLLTYKRLRLEACYTGTGYYYNIRTEPGGTIVKRGLLQSATWRESILDGITDILENCKELQEKTKHMKEYRNKQRAFRINTKNNTFGVDKYVVIAENFAEAEDIYWNELNGYNEILSIAQIEDVDAVAYRTDKGTGA